MVNTSNVVAAEKTPVKAGAEKINEKVAEKRRALGRGLESLLPGPRVVTTPADRNLADNTPPETTAGASAVPRVQIGGTAVKADGAAPTVENGRAEAPVAQTLTVPTLRASEEGQAEGDGVVQIPIDRILRNPYQTRKTFEEKQLTELSESIRVQGVLQPISVRPAKDGDYTLILGERRLRAAKLAGLEMVPAIVKRVSDQQAAEMTVVENLQRQDLNCIEQASSFAILSRNFMLTQEQIGKRVGMSRESVSNYMRLLTLAEGIVEALQKGWLTFSHAKLLLMIQDDVLRWKVAQKAIGEKMSVVRLEDMVLGVSTPKAPREEKPGGARWVDPNVKAAQRSLEEVLGMRVRIRDQHGRGRILIDYSTIDDFDRVVRMLKGA